MKYIVSVFITLILLAGGFYFYTVSQSSAPVNQTPTLLSSVAPSSQDSSSTQTAENGHYIEFSEGILDNTIGRRVLFFYANWCPICKPADADFKANVSKFPEDLTLIRVNYNDPDTDPAEKALAQKHGITYQHTFVQIDEAGNEVAKWNGGTTDKLLSEIQ